MAYMQVKEILDSATRIRRFMSEYARRHEQETPDDVTEGLFTEIKQHEERLLRCLADFADDASQGLLETWIQFPNETSLEQAMDQLSAAGEQDDEVVLQQILEAEQALIDVYDHVIGQSHAPRVRELFEELKTLEDHNLRTIADNVSELGQTRRS